MTSTLPRRVLYVNPNADLYGASRCLLRLIDGLDREQYLPQVALPEQGPLTDALSRRDVPFHVLPWLPVVRRRVFRTWRIIPFLLSLVPSVLQIAALLRREGIGIVHTNTGVTPTPALAARISGIPHVWHLREMFANEFAGLWTYYSWFMLRLSDVVLAVSTPIAEQFRGHSKVRVVYDGIDPVTPDAQSGGDEQRRREYCRAGERLVGTVGRLSPRKGQDVLLRSAVLLQKEEWRGIRYVLAGDAFPGNEWYVDELRAFAQDNDLAHRVEFPGFVEDGAALIGALDVLVVPSVLPEAFPGVVVEAMMLGVPVIATRSGGVVEQLQDGVTGWLVPPGDAAAIADRVIAVLRDSAMARAMASRARQVALTTFTTEAMVRKTEAAYAELCGQSKDAPRRT